ncbi:MAG: hypothetical protein RLY93_20525 [Sumerlaeia bacterium]
MTFSDIDNAIFDALNGAVVLPGGTTRHVFHAQDPRALPPLPAPGELSARFVIHRLYPRQIFDRGEVMGNYYEDDPEAGTIDIEVPGLGTVTRPRGYIKKDPPRWFETTYQISTFTRSWETDRAATEAVVAALPRRGVIGAAGEQVEVRHFGAPNVSDAFDGEGDQYEKAWTVVVTHRVDSPGGQAAQAISVIDLTTVFNQGDLEDSTKPGDDRLAINPTGE